MFPVHFLKPFFRQVFLGFNLFYDNTILEHFHRVILFLTLFTEDQQSLAINLKIILLQCKSQELRLSAVQETCHKINHNFRFIHLSSPPVPVRIMLPVYPR